MKLYELLKEIIIKVKNLEPRTQQMSLVFTKDNGEYVQTDTNYTYDDIQQAVLNGTPIWFTVAPKDTEYSFLVTNIEFRNDGIFIEPQKIKEIFGSDYWVCSNIYSTPVKIIYTGE